MKEPTATIDVVIVNYRGVDDTLQALERLGPWDKGRVFVVDNSAHFPEETQSRARLQQACEHGHNRQYLDPQENLGFGRACNLAFAQSGSAYFLLLNPDAHISPADVDHLAQALNARADLGAVSPKTFWNAAKTWVLPKPFGQTPMHALAMALGSRWPGVMKWAAQWTVRRTVRQMGGDELWAVDFLAGAVLLLRRQAVLQAGGLFDPQFFMFFEDADLSVRLRRKGFRLALVPRAQAVHTYRHQPFKAGMMATSQRQYLLKHHALFWRLCHVLRLLQWLGRPVDVERWFEVLSGTVQSAGEFAELTGHVPVWAWSPSVQMMPAVVRPDTGEAGGFSELEWDLLEPGAYTALLGDSGQYGARRRWVYFVKA